MGKRVGGRCGVAAEAGEPQLARIDRAGVADPDRREITAGPRQERIRIDELVVGERATQIEPSPIFANATAMFNRKDCLGHGARRARRTRVGNPEDRVSEGIAFDLEVEDW